MSSRIILIFLSFILILAACKKWEDKAATPDSHFVNHYCNDPEAVNYNWNFPGTPDNTTCFYPTEVFTGNYLLLDTVYYSAKYTFKEVDSVLLNLNASSRTKLEVKALKGWCPGKVLNFTADRFFKAIADSLKLLPDSTALNGQLFCRDRDTLSGFILRSRSDSTRIRINFTVVTDTGISYHVGTAIKQ